MEPESPLFLRAFESDSVEATEALGCALAVSLEPGAVIALCGELGAGKTALVRGLARGLEAEGPVNSPTYTLMHAYPGRLPLYHFDAWMEGREAAFLADGGDSWLYQDGVAAIEWAERVKPWLPPLHLAVELAHRGPQERLLRLRLVGPAAEGGAWARRLEALEPPPGLREVPPRVEPPAGRRVPKDP